METLSRKLWYGTGVPLLTALGFKSFQSGTSVFLAFSISSLVDPIDLFLDPRYLCGGFVSGGLNCFKN